MTEIYLYHACSYHEIEDGNGAPGGDRLHGGAPGTNPLPWSTGTQTSCWYQCREIGGEMYTCVSKINVAYQLQDSTAADGGFVSAAIVS